MKPRPFSKKIFFTGVYIGIIFLAMVFLGELSIRIYKVVSGKGGNIWLPDEYLGVIHAPNSRFLYEESYSNEFHIRRKTNSFGLVGKQVTLRKSENTARIIVLGDSFTEALQVEEGRNYCELLQDKLNSAYHSEVARSRHSEVAGRRILEASKILRCAQDDAVKPAQDEPACEVLNAGMSGFSPISEFFFLKRELLRLKPDVVILQLFANDVFEDNKARAMSLLDNRGMPVKISRFFVPDKKKASALSSVQEFWPQVIYRIKKAIAAKSMLAQSIARAQKNLFKRSKFHQRMSARPEFYDFNQFFIIQDDHPLFRDEPFRTRTWEQTRKYILAIRDLTKVNGAKFYLFYIPPVGQLKWERYNSNCCYFVLRPNTYLNQRLAELSRQEGIAYLDLLEIFRQRSEEDLYFTKDCHLNSEGHAVVADSLFRLLF